jgi:hypothetical protein
MVAQDLQTLAVVGVVELIQHLLLLAVLEALAS